MICLKVISIRYVEILQLCKQMIIDKKVCNFKKMQRNIENIIMIVIKHLEINLILALNDP